MILQNPEAMEDALTLFEGRYTFLSERFKSQAFEEVIDGCFTAILSLQDESLRSRFALLRAHAIGRLDGVEAYQTALSEVALSFPIKQQGKRQTNVSRKSKKSLLPMQRGIAFGLFCF
ncbi:MAG: hypothetical protein CM15mP83_0700 [Flavobacteriaceae bacterium]|nr:MAG: hypothetical protein CM15mP83_0700 [Flavobacteriaceae bacterium]